MENQENQSTAAAPQVSTNGEAKGLNSSSGGMYSEAPKTDASKEVQQSTQDPKTQDPKTEASKEVEVKKEGELKEGEKKIEGAPEKYEDFKAPEGVQLDPDAINGFTSFAKEAGLSQEKAQKAIDLATAHFSKLQLMQETQRAETFKSWQDKVKSDPVLGGSNYEKNLEKAKLGVRLANDPELIEILDSGWGNHPAMFKHFMNFADRFGEDKLVTGSPSAVSLDVSDKLYGKN